MLFQKKDKRVGQIIVTEVLPIYHDIAKTANKSLFKVIKGINESKVLCRELNTSYNKEMIYCNNKVLKQNEIPIIVKKNLSKAIFDKDFTKEGYVSGQVYEFRGLGYSGDLESLGIVYIVTDDYVVFNGDGKQDFFLYSYPELSRLCKERMRK